MDTTTVGTRLAGQCVRKGPSVGSLQSPALLLQCTIRVERNYWKAGPVVPTTKPLAIPTIPYTPFPHSPPCPLQDTADHARGRLCTSHISVAITGQKWSGHSAQVVVEAWSTLKTITSHELAMCCVIMILNFGFKPGNCTGLGCMTAKNDLEQVPQLHLHHPHHFKG